MISKERKDELLFPYDEVRPEQHKLLLLTAASIENKRSLLVHAPTGLGKTAGSLAPALAYAIKHNKIVFFLTSRHTQHKIAMDTLRVIKERYGINTNAVSMIGKKWMCLQNGVENMSSGDFSYYCRKLREEKKCNFYIKTRKNPQTFSMGAKQLLESIEKYAPLTSEQMNEHAAQREMCPYELTLGMAKKAQVIIGDYYYLFHPTIAANLLTKLERDLSDIIVIIDEAHNLPDRIKNLSSEFLSTITLSRAKKEATKYGYSSMVEIIDALQDKLDFLTRTLKVGQEQYIAKHQITKPLEDFDLDEVIADLESAAESVREHQRQSSLGMLAQFLQMWQGEDEGYARIISVKKGMRSALITVAYRCLDPALISGPVFEAVHSTILMSGTLLPTHMYRELLGLDGCQEVVFKDPFPKKNRLNLIIPKTTTKFQHRNAAQYQNIADEITKLTELITGNMAVFFPSYYIRDQIAPLFHTKTRKTVFYEDPQMSKEQKLDMLDQFKALKNKGAVLLGVASGSFGEGIDLPGDFLKAVVIVGLPLGTPDLETKSLIDYYDNKFGKGWDYGYVFPAFNTTLQNAGRCIRSESDKGIIIFLDERYAWPRYKRCFPEDWEIEVSKKYEEIINGF